MLERDQVWLRNERGTATLSCRGSRNSSKVVASILQIKLSENPRRKRYTAYANDASSRVAEESTGAAHRYECVRESGRSKKLRGVVIRCRAAEGDESEGVRRSRGRTVSRRKQKRRREWAKWEGG